VIEWLWAPVAEFAQNVAANFGLRDALDIAVVAALIYMVLRLVRGTRAVQVMVGLVALVVLSLLADLFQLFALRTILLFFLPSAPLIVVVLFQNDIRRGLARVGRGLFLRSVTARMESQMLEEVVRAAQTLSKRRIGALIVLERETVLDDQIEAGSQLDAVVSKELLCSIFQPPSPLHDGAALIQNGRLASAGCILPLTQRSDLPEGLGTRHRAAVGITEETDAVVVVVSEETAAISVVLAGEVLHDLDAPRLRVALRDALSGELRGARETAAGEPATNPDAAARESSLPTQG
jgi:uncharacterized protein (TIGR00159 family)